MLEVAQSLWPNAGISRHSVIPPIHILHLIVAVLSENKHSVVTLANKLPKRIGEIYNVLILYILSLKSSVETSRFQ